jgi:hypothetical protein
VPGEETMSDKMACLFGKENTSFVSNLRRHPSGTKRAECVEKTATGNIFTLSAVSFASIKWRGFFI